MEHIEFLSGVLMVSADPTRLAAFYRDVLGIPLEAEDHEGTMPHWGCTLGDVHFAIHPVEDFPDSRAAVGAVKLAFTVFDLSSVVAELAQKDVQLLRPPEDTGYFLSAMLCDPDGNLIELTQLGDDWFEYLQARREQGNDVVVRADERGANNQLRRPRAE